MEDALESLTAGEVEMSMVLIVKNDGDRLYLHPFDDDIHALEFLELMVSSYRTDIMERIIKRSMN